MSSSTKPDLGAGSEPAWTDGVAEAAPSEVEPERYEPSGELGRGGMGVVQAARDTWLDREVAIKRPRTDLPPAMRQRLLREARITARLVHPGIVPILDLATDEDGTYYTMPVLDGRSLADALQEGDLGLVGQVRILIAASRALAYAHAHGVVHRDVKPANIQLGSFGEVRVLDWGVALDPAAPDRQPCGTPGFWSPEQEHGGEITPASDVYSLGTVLRLFLEGQLPPSELVTVAGRCRADEPGERYPHAGALADELERWLDGRRVQAHDYSPMELLGRLVTAWRAPLIVGGLAFCIMLALLVGWTYTNQIERDRALQAQGRSLQARIAADANLARALSQQAAGFQRAGARPQAEVLAAHALALADSPQARGVLMAWHGAPRLAKTHGQPTPCVGAIPNADATAFLCFGAGELGPAQEVTVRTANGAVIWSANVAKDQIAPVANARLLAGNTALVHRENGKIGIWRDGELLANYVLIGPRLGHGPEPTLVQQGRVARVNQDGSLTWYDTPCAVVGVASATPERLMVGCNNSVVAHGSWGEPLERLELPGSPSALAWWRGMLVVGTWHGELLVREGDRWRRTPSGVKAPLSLVPTHHGLALRGERGSPRLWLPETGAFLGEVPGRAHRMASRDEQWILVDEHTVASYAPDGPLHPVHFDRASGGGLGFLDVNPEGTELLAGSANGEVITWQTSSGRLEVVAGPSNGTAKAGAYLDDVLLASRIGAPLQAFDRTTRIPLDWQLGSAARRVAGAGTYAAAAPYGSQVCTWDISDHESPTCTTLNGQVVGLAVRDGMTWALDTSGTLWRGRGEVAPLFELPFPGWITVLEDRIITTQRHALEAYTHDGGLIWRWENTGRLLSVSATENLVATGDRDGRVMVLSRDGRLLASAQGHERLVSSVRIAGDTLFSASWDGTAQRWGLGAAIGPAQHLINDVTQAWQLTAEQVLSGPPP
jgi:hypothetical protein